MLRVQAAPEHTPEPGPNTPTVPLHRDSTERAAPVPRRHLHPQHGLALAAAWHGGLAVPLAG